MVLNKVIDVVVFISETIPGNSGSIKKVRKGC